MIYEGTYRYHCLRYQELIVPVTVTGFGAAWHLTSIEVEDLTTRKVFLFHCDKWLSKSEDDKQILRELTCGTAAKGSSPNMRDKTSKYTYI